MCLQCDLNNGDTIDNLTDEQKLGLAYEVCDEVSPFRVISAVVEPQMLPPPKEVVSPWDIPVCELVVIV